MSTFQYIGSAFILFLVVICVVGLIRGRTRRGATILWLLVWLAAGAAILVPGITTRVANFLGIERGADLIFYCAVLGGLVGFFLVFLRMRNLNRKMTRLVRAIAMENPQEPSTNDNEADGDGKD